MKRIKITALRQTVYTDLMEQYENPMENACEIRPGQVFYSENGQRPDGLCLSAWGSMESFVGELARGGGNFFDGWMKDPHTALVSCNDGFRPVSFLLEVAPEDQA